MLGRQSPLPFFLGNHFVFAPENRVWSRAPRCHQRPTSRGWFVGLLLRSPSFYVQPCRRHAAREVVKRARQARSTPADGGDCGCEPAEDRFLVVESSRRPPPPGAPTLSAE